jgi:hypothetical protein
MNIYNVEDIPMIYVDFVTTVIRVSGKNQEALYSVSPLLFLIIFYLDDKVKDHDTYVFCVTYER